MDRELDRLLIAYREEVANRDALKTTHSAAEESVSTLNKQIIEALEEGKSTGDRILDLAWRTHGCLDSGIVQKYKDIEGRLRGRVGEFALVVHGTEQELSNWRSDRPREYEYIDMYRIGVVAGEQLVFRTADRLTDYRYLTLPVEKYVEGFVHAIHTPPKSVEVESEHINMWRSHGTPSLSDFV